MFCTHCGAKNEGGNKFCTSCGKPLEDSNVGGGNNQPAQQQVQPAPSVVTINVNSQPQPQATPYSTDAQVNNNQYLRGCAGQAWDDIKIAGGWFGRALLLFLIAIVPILNFCAIGYAYSLSRHAVLDAGDPLPRDIVNGNNFKTGFFALVITLIGLILLGLFTILPTILFFASLLIPLGVAWIFIDIIVLIFGGLFLELMVQRGCLISFRAAFHLGKVWEGFKTKFGSLFVLDLLPGLLFGLIGSGLFFTLIIPVVCTQLSGMVNCRAYGIYIRRFLPDWVDEVRAAEGYFGAASVQAQQPVQVVANAPVQNQQADPVFVPAISPANSNPEPKPVSKPVVVPTPKKTTNNGDDCGTTILSTKEVILKKKSGKTYSIIDFPCVIGKGSAADCVIKNDTSISREQAKIHEYGDDGFVIEDLHSSNKTFLNGETLTPEELVVLSDGDKLKIGRTELSVTINL